MADSVIPRNVGMAGLLIDRMDDQEVVRLVRRDIGVADDGRKMSQTELVVAMLEAGYQTSMNSKKLRDAVGVVLRGDERFGETGGKWATDVGC